MYHRILFEIIGVWFMNPGHIQNIELDASRSIQRTQEQFGNKKMGRKKGTTTRKGILRIEKAG
jgi:hypothetical protein